MKKFFKKFLNKEEYKDAVRRVLVIFLIVQPLLDLYMNLFDEKIQIMGVSLATLLRFGVVFALLVAVLCHEIKRKSAKLFLCYAAVVAVYTVAHHFNAVTFSVKLAQADYSLIGELIYIARMCVPAALIYIIYNVKINFRDIKRIVIWGSLMISSVIIVTNLLKIGYMAYSTEDIVISGTMVSWFTGVDPTLHWSQLSCRGIFQATNQLSGITLVMVPILALICVSEEDAKKKVFNWVVLALHMIGMINLSTRIASVGGILLAIGVIMIFVLEKLIHKEISLKKISKSGIVSFCLCFLVVFVILMKSPMMLRVGEGNMFSDFSSTDKSGKVENEKNNNNENVDIDAIRTYKINYIEEMMPMARIQDLYIRNAYPYTEDYDFWYHVIHDLPESARDGNRNMRSLLIDRILERDDRFSNTLLGISYTRSSSFVWPERDIETHLDALGVIGTAIFLGPYFVVVLAGVWCFFRRFKDNLYLKRCVYLISAGIGVVAAYLSGHIMNEIFPAIYLAFACGIVINTCFGYYPDEPIAEWEENKEVEKND